LRSFSVVPAAFALIVPFHPWRAAVRLLAATATPAAASELKFLSTGRIYGIVTVMCTGAGFVTVPDPVGVKITMYVTFVPCGVGCLDEAPQAISKPASEMASTVSKIAHTRFWRTLNGIANSTAQNTAPPLFHGAIGP
jgi:hypothetical protein